MKDLKAENVLYPEIELKLQKKMPIISDEFWALTSPLIPKRVRQGGKRYKRKPGAGRKPMDPRKTFEAILYVLKSGIQWKALPKEFFGSPSSIHSYYLEWEEAGFFKKLWAKGFAKNSEMSGISWVRVRKNAVETVTFIEGKGEQSSLSDRQNVWHPVLPRRTRKKSRKTSSFAKREPGARLGTWKRAG